VNNYIRTLALDESLTPRTVFANGRKEGGINFVYDPLVRSEIYQVFIHNLLPYTEEKSWSFATFSEARSFAAKYFSEGWEMLSWDGALKRKCAEGGGSCGEGSCGTSGGGCSTGSCGTEGGGCSSCH
jgi:hypothetical protein